MIYDFTEIAMLLISLAFAVLAYMVAPWLKARLNTEQLTYVRSAVQVAVYAAEKLYGAGNGDKKLAYAEEMLAAKYNVKLDTKKLKTLIDSEIRRMEQADGKHMIESLPIIEEAASDEEEGGEEEEEEETQTEEA